MHSNTLIKVRNSNTCWEVMPRYYSCKKLSPCFYFDQNYEPKESELCGDVFKSDFHLTAGIADFLKIITITGHPMKATHFRNQFFPVSLNCSIKLRPTNIIWGMIYYLALESHPFYWMVVGNNIGYYLVFPKKYFWCSSIIWFTMCKDISWLQISSIHPSGTWTMGACCNSIMRVLDERFEATPFSPCFSFNLFKQIVYQNRFYFEG